MAEAEGSGETLGEATQRAKDFQSWYNGVRDWLGPNVTIPGASGTHGRGEGIPWKWRSADQMEDDHDLASEAGKILRWDPSGYASGYQLSFSPIATVKNSYQLDMTEFQQRGW